MRRGEVRGKNRLGIITEHCRDVRLNKDSGVMKSRVNKRMEKDGKRKVKYTLDRDHDETKRIL